MNRVAGSEVSMKGGRDHWWSDVVQGQSDDCPAEHMDAEDLATFLPKWNALGDAGWEMVACIPLSTYPGLRAWRLGWRTARSRMTRTTELERRLAGAYLLCDSYAPTPHRTLCHRCAPLLREALAGQS